MRIPLTSLCLTILTLWLVTPNFALAVGGGVDGIASRSSMVAVRDLVESGQAKFHVVKQKVHAERTEIEVVLVDNEGQSIGGLAPPYLPSQAAARPLWKDFITANLRLPVQPEQMTISETRQAQDQSFAVGFALDHSQSMTIPRAIRMQRAIQSAMKTFDPNDYVTVSKFTGSVENEVKLSKDRNQYLSQFKVDGLRSRNNGTAIYDAAIASMEELASAPDVSQRVLVLFTDGDDNSSSATLDDVIAKAKELNVKIHGVTYGVSNDGPIRKIAEETGGELHQLHHVYDFDKVFLGIYNALRHTYTISVRNRNSGTGDMVQGATMTAAGASAGSVRTNDVLALMPRQRVEIANTTSDDVLILSVDLLFAEQNHDVAPADVPLLDSIATVLIQKNDLVLEILNHKEAFASLEVDDQFMHKRAAAIRDLLIRRGVPPSRIQSYAGASASANNATRYADKNKTTFVFTML